MTSHSRLVRTFCALFLAALSAAPLFAAGRTRAVQHPNGEKVTVTGTVTDATTGLPLKGATVASGTMAVVTDDAGRYSLTCTLSSEIAASRIGYVTVKKPVSGTSIDFALPQTPSVTVKLTNGQTVVLDYGTTKFGYADVFQYVSGEGLTLCKAGDPNWIVLKGDMVKITGPAHSVTQASCCDRGPVMVIDIQTKDTSKTTAALNDSCFNIVNDVLGIERSSTQVKFIHLTDVSEITFP